MSRRIALSVAGFVALYAVSAHAADVAEFECLTARYLAASKYAGCEAKAASKDFADARFLKCRLNYARTWTKLAEKHPDTSCTDARFVDDGLTITDNLTTLVWEKKTTAVGSGVNASDRHDVDNVYSWTATSTNADGTAFTDFLDDLNSTGFAGRHDWRLPTLFELHTIMATNAVPCGTPPCVVDPLFLPMQSDQYWSSTTHRDDPLKAFEPGFGFGTSDFYVKTGNLYVRAVRAGY